MNKKFYKDYFSKYKVHISVLSYLNFNKICAMQFFFLVISLFQNVIYKTKQIKRRTKKKRIVTEMTQGTRGVFRLESNVPLTSDEDHNEVVIRRHSVENCWHCKFRDILLSISQQTILLSVIIIFIIIIISLLENIKLNKTSIENYSFLFKLN